MKFGDTQSLKCGRCWTLFNEILHFLYFHTTIAVFPNRFETRLLPSKRLNVFLGGDDISSLESELTVSQLAIARKPHFWHFKSAASTEIRRHERRRLQWNCKRKRSAIPHPHDSTRKRTEDSSEAQENTQYLLKKVRLFHTLGLPSTLTNFWTENGRLDSFSDRFRRLL